MVASFSTDPAIDSVVAELQQIRRALLNDEILLSESITSAKQAWQKSARNLVHCVSLGKLELHDLQLKLAALGLASLFHAERHILTTIDSMIATLLALAGKRPLHLNSVSHEVIVGFYEGRSLLVNHTEALLGVQSAEQGRVTMAQLPGLTCDSDALQKLVESGVRVVCIDMPYFGQDSDKIWPTSLHCPCDAFN